MLQYVNTTRNQRNRLDAAKELKKMVFFSNIVVAPLLEDLKVGWGSLQHVIAHAMTALLVLTHLCPRPAHPPTTTHAD